MHHSVLSLVNRQGFSCSSKLIRHEYFQQVMGPENALFHHDYDGFLTGQQLLRVRVEPGNGKPCSERARKFRVLYQICEDQDGWLIRGRRPWVEDDTYGNVDDGSEQVRRVGNGLRQRESGNGFRLCGQREQIERSFAYSTHERAMKR